MPRRVLPLHAALSSNSPMLQFSLRCALALSLGLTALSSPVRAGSALADSTVADAASATPQGSALKALGLWIKSYRRGKVDFRSPKDITKKSIAKKLRALPKGMLGRLTAKRELEILLEAAVKADSEDALERILEVASLGLDDATYTIEQSPQAVRRLGETMLAKCKSDTAKSFLAAAAKGETKFSGGKDEKQAMRAAALKAVGGLGDTEHRGVLEAALGAPALRLRYAAAQGLHRLRSADSVPALALLIKREETDLVVRAAVRALGATMEEHQKRIPVPMQQNVLEAVASTLGKGGWRADMARVDFLEQFRSGDAVPALIAVLQRFVDHPDKIRSGELSGLLRHRAHETLVSLTGAFFPMNRPDEWKSWWDTAKDNFKVAANKKDAKNKRGKGKGQPATVTNSFFGIPIRGTRVVFVVDRSGSMKFPMSGEAYGENADRIDAAKKELARAIDTMGGNAMFNMVTFSNRADTWQKKLIPANAGNKKRFVKEVEKMIADGGTNTWAAMQAAFDIKTLKFGARYDSSVDEIFVLSDGMPSIGDVVDAKEILELVRETNLSANVRINTVYIADELTENDRQTRGRSGMSGERFMKLLAEQNGGKAIKL